MMTRIWVYLALIAVAFGYFMYAQTEIKSLSAAKAEAVQALAIAKKTIEEKEQAEKENAAALEELNQKLSEARQKEQKERAESEKAIHDIEANKDASDVEKEQKQLNDLTSKQLKCLEQLVNGRGSNARC